MVVAASSVRMDPDALARIEQLFQQQIEEHLHPGAALAVYRHGKPVLDLYAGIADKDSGRRVAQDTMFVLYSSTKPLAAASLYILWERGKLVWDDPVAKYWPEFSANGKAGVTVRHILTHQGGFPETPQDLTWDKFLDWDAVVRAMEGATPIYAPGTEIAYHSINFGWVIAELVRRIDGRSFDEFIRDELTAPLGMADTYVGLPGDQEHRVSRVHPMGDLPGDRLEFIADYNRPEVHQAVVPAACGIATARDLARFYAMMANGGALDGVTVLKPATVAEVTRLQVQGMDRTIGQYVRRALGFALGDERMGCSDEDGIATFGHGGAGTSVGWADPESGLAVAYITNGFQANETNNPRLAAVSRAVRDACR
ncbi:MAG: beta-lactamase family protein [Chloroflexi bacterium]|nr:beta-lactamase family protein [Chloroflexota bacterium]